MCKKLDCGEGGYEGLCREGEVEDNADVFAVDEWEEEMSAERVLIVFVWHGIP